MTDVLSKNPFDLLGDDGEEAAPSASPAKKPTQKKEAPVSRPDTGKKDTRAPRNEYPRRGGFAGQQRGGAVEGSAPRGDRVARTGPRETGDFERPPRTEGGEQRGGFRGGRGGRGRGGAGAGGRGREFDRRSGTGRRDGEKKEVAGKGSWGNAATAEEESKTVDVAADGAVAEGAPAAEGEKPAEEEVAKEPEEVLKTLDQYVAEVEAKKAAAALNVRKPNEGADDSQWKDAVVLKKEEEDFFVGKGAKGKKSVAAAAKEKAAKVFAPIEQRFADEPKRGGFGRGRGGRGGDRPQTGERRGRGGRSAGVNVDDQTAFPTLGSK
ncbi:hypothetical protein HK104_010617 [Borealophlyctis nickersoniae]|nr:hypothetical protein HK104_010617 [Borealophlyctis nickersoniae]